jgi:3-oxoacyl-[acyl-carrier-protein] synthase-3
MTRIAIRGLGTYVPDTTLSNAALETLYGPFVSAVSEQMGIRQRHWSVDPATGVLCEDNAALASQAARRALDDAAILPTDIDLIVLATSTPDYMAPGPAAFVQDRLGAINATVLDLRAGCFGLAQGVSIAQQYLRSGACTNVLVIGSELFSPLLHAALGHIDKFRPRQRTLLYVTAALFGDGAGAMVLARASADTDTQVLDCQTYSIGHGRPPGLVGALGGVKLPLFIGDGESVEVLTHDYEAISRFFTEVGNRVFDSLGDHPRIWFDDFALIVPAQANGRIRDLFTTLLRERCGSGDLTDRADEKIFLDIEDVGNTGAASIYIALEKIRRSGRVQPGQKLLLVPGEATKWFYGTITLRH